MKLQRWMTANGYSLHDVAKAVEAAPHTVANWLQETHVPGKAKMAKIIELTGGQTTPNDFYSLPKKKPAK